MNVASLKTFRHGVHPPDSKELTRGLAVRRLPFAPEYIVLLSQHTGAPARPLVRKGQEVVRGEPIAAPGGFVSVPMHAPVTGVVTKIDVARTATGSMAPAVYIRAYPGSSQEVLYGGAFDVDSASPPELVAAVQETGLVGLGGAAFPTHVKMAVPDGKSVDTVVANGCECEPFLTTDHRLMLERKEALFRGLAIALRATGARRALIAVENNQPDVILAFRAAVAPSELPVEVAPVGTKYPQGAEKVLIKALLHREVPSGGLPVDVHAAVFNVATLACVGDLVPRRQGLVERIITVTGSGVARPGNYIAPIGTPLRFLFDQLGFVDGARQVILGGPMMGVSAAAPGPRARSAPGAAAEDIPVHPVRPVRRGVSGLPQPVAAG